MIYVQTIWQEQGSGPYAVDISPEPKTKAVESEIDKAISKEFDKVDLCEFEDEDHTLEGSAEVDGTLYEWELKD